jgi:hypothetical protein
MYANASRSKVKKATKSMQVGLLYSTGSVITRVTVTICDQRLQNNQQLFLTHKNTLRIITLSTMD